MFLQAHKFNVARARTLYELALEANPQHLQTLLALGTLEGRAGQVEKGMGHLRKGLGLDPNNKYFQHAIAQMERHHGSREVIFFTLLSICNIPKSNAQQVCRCTDGKIPWQLRGDLLHHAFY